MNSSNLGSDLPDKPDSNTDAAENSDPEKLRIEDKYSDSEKNSPKKADFIFEPLLDGIKWGMIFSLTALFSAGIGATIALNTPLSSQIISWRKQLTAWVKTSYDQEPQIKVAEVSQAPTGLTRSVNILVMGSNEANSVPSSDTSAVNSLHVFRFDPQSPSVSLISIPPQTRINSRRTTAAFDQSEIDISPALATRNVSRVLNDLPIERYLRFTPQSIVELVDLVDGVEIYVPEEIASARDNRIAAISLDAGWQTLNGQQASHFISVNLDENESDLDRLQRQQILLQALHQRLSSPGIQPMLPRIVRRLHQVIETNLTTKELLALVSLNANLSEDQLRMVILPGESRSASWSVLTSRRDQILAEYLAYSPSDDLNLSPATATSLKIAVQNTTSQSSLARFTSEYLQQQDYQEVYVIGGQSNRPLRQTEIIVQRGQIQAAREIQQALGLGKLVLASVGDRNSDITIRLGDDAQQVMNDFWGNKTSDK